MGQDCWCGNSFGNYDNQLTTDCRVTCRGDNLQYCGGTTRNYIYRVDGMYPNSHLFKDGRENVNFLNQHSDDGLQEPMQPGCRVSQTTMVDINCVLPWTTQLRISWRMSLVTERSTICAVCQVFLPVDIIFVSPLNQLCLPSIRQHPRVWPQRSRWPLIRSGQQMLLSQSDHEKLVQRSVRLLGTRRKITGAGLSEGTWGY